MIRSALTIIILIPLVGGCLPRSDGGSGSEVKVVGGTPVAAGDPIAMLTAALTKPNGQMLCSAILVSPTIVVTAAHCLTTDYTRAGMSVVFGATVATGVAIPGKAFLQHPQYDPTAKDSSGKTPYDIGLVQLSAPVDPATGTPVAIVGDDVTIAPYTTPITIAGFGLTASTGGTAGTLRSATTFMSTDANTTSEVFTDSLSVKNACHGDSGGPALLSVNGAYVALGAASYTITIGDQTCETGLASYTDLRKYRDWITQNTGS